MRNFFYREPSYEWFETCCGSCRKALPDHLDPVVGGVIHDGDVCPYCGAVLQEHEDMKTAIKAIAKRHDYDIREERLEPMVLKFEQQIDKYGDMYCPCQLQQNEDTLCPCRYMREQGACRCGLYIKKE
jgi:ferredoxin-thioredoxin reductase catalytic subunit